MENELKDLYTALAQAQAEFPMIGKNRRSHYGDYTDADALLNPLWPTLKKYGLSVHEELDVTNEGRELLSVVLGHSSGQEKRSTCFLRPKGEKDADWGACVTFRRRYLYRGILGIAVSDDPDDHDDNNERRMDANRSGVITVEQQDELLLLIEKKAESKKIYNNILKFNKIDDLSELKASSFGSVKGYISNSN